VQHEEESPARGRCFAEVAKREREPGDELQVHGSMELIRTRMERDVVDERRLLDRAGLVGVRR